MEQTRWDELRHDIKTKSVSLQEAVKLLRDSGPDESREILMLMGEAARDIARYVSELEKDLDDRTKAR